MMISIDDFNKVDLRVVRVLEAERVEGSEKLLRLVVSMGKSLTSSELFVQNEEAIIDEVRLEEKIDTRQIVSGIGRSFVPDDLINKEIVIVANLEPRKLMGLDSYGMVLAVHDEDGGLALIKPSKDVPEGTRVG